ncbi:MAG: universal stress protein [Tetrasphaera sp.]
MPGSGKPKDKKGTNRVVVGVDGSKASERALRWGRFIADNADATLEAVMAWQHTVEWAPVIPLELSIDVDQGEHAKQALHACTERAFKGKPPKKLKLHTGEGYPAKVLIDRSKEAMMVVLGSRGHGGFSGLMLGSVSTLVARHGSCPVLIIHGDEEPPA